MRKKKVKAKFSKEELIKRKFPISLISAVLLLSVLGINKLSDVKKIDNLRKLESEILYTTVVSRVVDGDTFEQENGGVSIRLVGINAPNRGEVGDKEAMEALTKMAEGKQVWLEFDRYQDDKYNRLLAWVWINCESKPEFLPYDYMHLSYNQSREGLIENPEGCKKGRLLNEEMLKKGFAKVEVFKERGELKYEERLKAIK